MDNNKNVHSHIVHSYDSELNSINNLIVRMGKLVKEILVLAGKSIYEKNPGTVELAKSIDKRINQYDAEIETKATSLIALRQPMAIDLRLTISALKMAVILERMGDLSKQGCIRLEKVEIKIDNSLLEKIIVMNEMVVMMIDEVMNAFINGDDNKALHLFLYDQHVDRLYADIITKLKEHIKNFPESTNEIIELIFTVKNFERLGDNVTKIASIIHYIITGEKRFSIASEEDKNVT